MRPVILRRPASGPECRGKFAEARPLTELTLSHPRRIHAAPA
jgi:hypothetical protein